MRLVCKTWLEWISITDFTFGLVRTDEIPQLSEIFSRYTKPISFNIKKSQLLFGYELEPLWKLTNLTSLSIDNLISDVCLGISKLTNLSSLEVLYPNEYDLRAMTQLTRLKISKFDLRWPLSNLESLHFYRELDQYDSADHLMSFSRLTELTVGLPATPMDMYRLLIESSPLKRLTMTYPEVDLVGSAQFFICTKLAALESLETDILFDENALNCDTLTRLVAQEHAGPRAHKMTSHLTNLKELRVALPELETILYLINLPKLESLALTGKFPFGHRFMKYLPNPMLLTNLEIMFLNAPQDDFVKLTSLRNLKALSLTSQGMAEVDLSCMSVLTNLTLLSVECNEGTSTSLQWTTALTGLQKLHLAMPGRGDTYMVDHFSVTNLTRLTYLFCRSVADGFDLSGLTNLRELTLSNIKEHIDTHGLETLQSLTNIIMVHPMPEEQWQSIIQLTQLQAMYIEYEGKDADQKLEQLTALKHLTSFMCMQSSWTGRNLSRLASLQSLTFGTKNALAVPSYANKLKNTMPLMYECTYFEDFMSSVAAFWSK